jgi:predicted Zn-dependent peptidase
MLTKKEKLAVWLIAITNPIIGWSVTYLLWHESQPEKQRYAARVLATLLGGNMSSRLFTSVRERRGLCYSIRADFRAYSDTGSFVVEAGLDAQRILEAIRVFRDELAKIRRKAPTEEEVQRSKEYIIGKTTLALEDSEKVAEWYGRGYLMTGEIAGLEEIRDRIRAVRAGDLRDLAASLFIRERMALVCIGSLKAERPAIETLLTL